jgi:aminoglycoside 2''-phosphotransferase
VSILPEYIKRIETISPGLDANLARLNQEGMVNDVVAFPDGPAFRFPKSDWALAAMIREARILDLVRGHVSVPIPELQMHGSGLASYRWLPGQPMTREYVRSLAVGARRTLLAEVGTFLRQMHSIPASELAVVGASTAVRTHADWLAFYDQVRESIFPLLMGYQRTSVEAWFKPVVDGTLDLETKPVPIHGDIAPYHLLVDPLKDSLCGVIDFGVAGLGDPATDFSLLLYNYGENLVQEMAHVYPLNDDLMRRSRFRARALELEWALSGLRIDDKSLLVAHIGSARGFADPGVDRG